VELSIEYCLDSQKSKNIKNGLMNSSKDVTFIKDYKKRFIFVTKLQICESNASKFLTLLSGQAVLSKRLFKYET